jgi:uncharacterized protein DUF4260
MFIWPDRPYGEAMTTRTLLRLEGLTAAVLAVLAYHHVGGGWGMFAALFLVPDLSLLGYLAGPRVGAATYNTVHTYLFAAALAALGLYPFAAIAAAHVGLDRALGYGLKHATSAHDTHLGPVGKRVTATSTRSGSTPATASHPA